MSYSCDDGGGTMAIMVPGDLVSWDSTLFGDGDYEDPLPIFLVLRRYHVMDPILVLAHTGTGTVFECPEEWFRLVSDGHVDQETDPAGSGSMGR